MGPKDKFLHYYGHITRRYFMAGAVILMLAILIDREFLSFYLFVGVFGVLIVTILAGATNPRTHSVLVSNVAVSAFMFLVFEYLAINAYLEHLDYTNTTFFIRQALSVIFLISLYFSTKTLRGKVVEEIE